MVNQLGTTSLIKTGWQPPVDKQECVCLWREIETRESLAPSAFSLQ